jgi:hypothetical protein
MGDAVTVSAARRAGRWRWVVVGLGVAVLASLPALISARPVQVSPLSVADLYARMRASTTQPYQGFVTSNGTAGLPSIPQLSDAIALLNGETQLRVWYAGPQRWRVDQIGEGTERDLYQAADYQVLWDFGANQLTTITGDQPLRLPRGSDVIPPELARRVFATAGPQPSELSPLPPRRVAGLAAAGLRFTPHDPVTTVGHVDIWADPASGLPVQVEITGRNASTPIFVTRFLDLDLTPPDGAALTPPAGGPNTSYTAVDGRDIAQAFRSLRPGPLPTTLSGAARTDDPTTSVGPAVYGTGLTRVVVIPVPRSVGGDAFDRVKKAGGRLNYLLGGATVVIATPILSVLVLDTGNPRRMYILVGLVTPSVLQPAAADLTDYLRRVRR